MRLRARVDDNQPDITKALRAAGWSVALTHQLGKGFPDMVLGKHRRNYLGEVKNDKVKPSARKLTADEAKWQKEWRGAVHILLNPQQAVEEMERTLRAEELMVFTVDQIYMIYDRWTRNPAVTGFSTVEAIEQIGNAIANCIACEEKR